MHYALQAWIDSGVSEKGRFLIAGDLNFFPEYRKKIEPLLVHPSIRELGVVSDVGSLLRKSHVLLLPTLEEGSAKVTYEARACGCVLAVSDHAGAHCRHMENGLVHKAGDVATLRQQLRMLAEDHTLLKRLRENSIAGLDRLTWTHAATVLIGEYYKAFHTVN